MALKLFILLFLEEIIYIITCSITDFTLGILVFGYLKKNGCFTSLHSSDRLN